MRICLVSGEYPPDEGGVADYTRCLAEALAQTGQRVDVLTSRRSTTVKADVQDRYDHLPITVHRIVRRWRWSAIRGLLRMVVMTRPDVIHLQYQTAAYGMHPAINYAPFVLRRRGPWVNVAVTYHDLRVPYLFPKAGRLRDAVTLRPARDAHLTIATNTEDCAALAARTRPWQLALVPIGSNIADAPPPDFERAAWRQAAGLPPQSPHSSLIAYFGFLNASKGGLTLLAALDTLRRSGRDARLVMIGGTVGASDPTNEAYLAEFKSAAAALSLTDAILWTGHIPTSHVSAWLHAADAVALPYHDGASYRRGSLLAALAHGTPVVTTRPTDQADWLTGHENMPSDLACPPLPPLVDGQSARLVPAEDAAALAAALAEVLDDPALAARLGAGGRAVAEAFAWPAIAARHVALYRELMLPF